MKRILFVDDEPRILDGIRRMLHSRRDVWEIETAEGGEAALARLAEREFDVIVSDMRMPGMNGAEFLRLAQARHPRAIRMVLSGHSDQMASLRAVLVAHQFAAKPLAADELVKALERACSLSDLLSDEDLRAAVGSIEALPESPRVYQQCNQALSEDGSAEAVARVVERDPGLAAKLLQIVNSAFFGLPQRTADLERAVTYLGTETIRGIVLAMESLQIADAVEPIGPVGGDTIMEASILAAQLTRRLRFDSREMREAAYTGALLHDIGLLALLRSRRDRLAAAVARAAGEGIPLTRAQVLSGDPPQNRVGAYLLGAWALPLDVVEAVRDHEGPEAVEANSHLTGAIHLVDRAVKRALARQRGQDPYTRVYVCERFLELHGGLRKLEELEEEALERIGNSSDLAA